MMRKDKNSKQASDQDFDQVSNHDESFESAQETLDEMKTDISRSNTQYVKIADENENKNNQLKENTNKEPEIETEMTPPGEMTPPDKFISNETKRLSKGSQDQGNSTETKILTSQTPDEWLNNIKQDIIAEASVEPNSQNSDRTVDKVYINVMQTTQFEEANGCTITVAESLNACDENERKGKSTKTNKSEEMKNLYLINTKKEEKELSRNTEKKRKTIEEVKAQRAEVMKELLIGYSQSLKVVFGKTVSSFYQYFFWSNEQPEQ